MPLRLVYVSIYFIIIGLLKGKNIIVGIVILNFNNSCATKKCLESIIEYESSDKYKICLVDYSTDTVDRARTMENVDDLRRKEPLADIHVIL